MIIKNFDLNIKNLKNNKYFLVYGNNTGLIKEIIEDKLEKGLTKNVFKYEETEILKDLDGFNQTVSNQSFFETEKLIIISRVTDKIFDAIEDIVSKNFEDLYLILQSGPLDKKSNLRKFFEKEKKTIAIPVYEDNLQTLSGIVSKFMRNKNVNISQQTVNIIVERASGDRININNELDKIENYILSKKNVSTEDILRITNLSENYSISELVDSCLSKNKKKILKILNENNFNSEDCIIILRTFLIKLKRLIRLHEEFETNNRNIDLVLSSFKPPIFWKDKEIVKQQIKSYNYKKAKNLVIKTNEIELLIKKNPHASLNLTTDFMISYTD